MRTIYVVSVHEELEALSKALLEEAAYFASVKRLERQFKREVVAPAERQHLSAWKSFWDPQRFLAEFNDFGGASAYEASSSRRKMLGLAKVIGVDASVPNFNDKPAFYIAVESGCGETVELLLRNAVVDPNAEVDDEDGDDPFIRTALTMALLTPGLHDAAWALLKSPRVSANEMTLLDVLKLPAAERRVKLGLLVSSGKVEPASWRNEYGGGLMHVAVDTGDPAVVDQVLALGADANAVDDEGNNALHW